MFSKLKWFKFLSVFDDNDRNVILAKFFDLIKIGVNNLFSAKDYHKTAIHIMINNETRRKINDDKKNVD